MNKNSEPLSDHPLFRALVLMGGGLALSCGGVARTDHDPNASSGSSGASGSSGSTTAEPGGSGPSVITTGGSTSTVDAGPPPMLDCPTEQYDCGPLPDGTCAINLSTALATGTCVCDHSRPTSVKNCKPNENLVCLQGYYSNEAQAGTWDGTTHVQCACIPSPIPATFDNCLPACVQAFPQNDKEWMGCSTPSPCTFDDSGGCTATSADVLYQDGIMCGCASLGLK